MTGLKMHYKVSVLLGYGVVSFMYWCLTFWERVVLKVWKVQGKILDFLTLWDETTMLPWNIGYQSPSDMRNNIPEEWRPQDCKSLKICSILWNEYKFTFLFKYRQREKTIFYHHRQTRALDSIYQQNHKFFLHPVFKMTSVNEVHLTTALCYARHKHGKYYEQQLFTYFLFHNWLEPGLLRLLWLLQNPFIL